MTILSRSRVQVEIEITELLVALLVKNSIYEYFLVPCLHISELFKSQAQKLLIDLERLINNVQYREVFFDLFLVNLELLLLLVSIVGHVP